VLARPVAAEVQRWLDAGADVVFLPLAWGAGLSELPAAGPEVIAKLLTIFPREQLGVVVDEGETPHARAWIRAHVPAHVAVGLRPQGDALREVADLVGATFWRVDTPMDYDDFLSWHLFDWGGAAPEGARTVLSVLEDGAADWTTLREGGCTWSLADLARTARHHRVVVSIGRLADHLPELLRAVPQVDGIWCLEADATGLGWGHVATEEEVRAARALLEAHQIDDQTRGADGVHPAHREGLVRLVVDVAPEDDTVSVWWDALMRLEAEGVTLEVSRRTYEPLRVTMVWACWSPTSWAETVAQAVGRLSLGSHTVTLEVVSLPQR
jgi:hypothetical protein